MRRCNAPYHQCVSSTRNIVAYPSGRISLGIKRLAQRFGGAAVHRVAHDVLRHTGMIKIKPAEIFADQPENHELNSGEKYDAAQDRGNANCQIWSDPKLV